MSPAVQKLLDEIPSMSREALTKYYRELYQLDPPHKLSRRLLDLAVAYRIQEKASGGLTTETRKFLMEGPSTAKCTEGTVLIREWHGTHHTVRVLSDHVEYQGQQFRSLSAVARLITGTQRSGNAFFGVARHE